MPVNGLTVPGQRGDPTLVTAHFTVEGLEDDPVLSAHVALLVEQPSVLARVDVHEQDGLGFADVLVQTLSEGVADRLLSSVDV